MVDIALLVVRVVFGLLLLGHGAQKLFGWSGGPGLAGTTGWLGSLGLRPAGMWALAAALGEFAGGALLALGLLTPLASIAVAAAMVVAIVLVHSGKGIWASNGGNELPLMNVTVALALFLAGPGRYSLDASLGLTIPGPMVVTSLVGAAVAVAMVVAMGRSGRKSGRVASQATD